MILYSKELITFLNFANCQFTNRGRKLRIITNTPSLYRIWVAVVGIDDLQQ